jgi:hypothetical protein
VISLGKGETRCIRANSVQEVPTLTGPQFEAERAQVVERLQQRVSKVSDHDLVAGDVRNVGRGDLRKVLRGHGQTEGLGERPLAAGRSNDQTGSTGGNLLPNEIERRVEDRIGRIDPCASWAIPSTPALEKIRNWAASFSAEKIDR